MNASTDVKYRQTIIVFMYATRENVIVSSEDDYNRLLPLAMGWFVNNVTANANAVNLHNCLQFLSNTE